MTAVQPAPVRALSTLLAGIAVVEPAQDRVLSDLTLDSREVVPGSCFLALRGSRENAYQRYAATACARGAVAVVTDDCTSTATLPVPTIRIPALRRHLGLLARRYFADPSRALRVVAVTGTNGKTTVAHLTAQAYAHLGMPYGYVGTLGSGRLDALVGGANTTPDVISLSRTFASLRDAGCVGAALEASSHAIDQGRLDGLRLHTAAFTNLGRDHLDYHGDLAGYERAKHRLFAQPALVAAVINVDDASGARLIRGLPHGLELWTCSTRGRAPVAPHERRLNARDIALGVDGLEFELEVDGRAAPVHSRLIGRFNVDNLLMIAGLMLTGGIDFDRTCACLGQLVAVPGRLEACGLTARGARVFVDYAHTPDALDAVLGSLRALDPSALGVVFGCGGDRDQGKRPHMAAAVERHADWAIVTSDNPRGEAPDAIAAQITAGFSPRMDVAVVDDRAAAIRAALARGAAGGIVLIAGKGHETTQECAGLRVPFDDREQVRRALAEAAP